MHVIMIIKVVASCLASHCISYTTTHGRQLLYNLHNSH